MVTKESRTVTPTEVCDRSEYYVKGNVTGRRVARKNDQVRRLGTNRVEPVVTEDAPADGTGVATIHGNYLEISGPRIPGVFFDLAEEARNIVMVDGRSLNVKTAQEQRTGRTDPVFVTEIVNNCPPLRDGARVATGTSTRVIPNTNQRKQSEPVNRSNRVGQLGISDGRGVRMDRSAFSPDQSTSPELDVNGGGGKVPFIRRHPETMMSQIQPVADGPAGSDRTRRPVGTDGIQILHNGDRPMPVGPVGPVLHSDPLGPSRMPSLDDLHQPLTVDPWDTDGIYAVDASDWLTAGGPVDRSLGLDPMGPSEMLALDVYNQPRVVGPVGKPSRPGPVAQPHTVDAPDWLTAGEPVTRLRGSDPMGPREMLSSDVYSQPQAVGPVGKPSRPGPTAHPHTVDAPDWPTAGEPVTRLHSSDPMGPSGMLLRDGYNQPPTVGPVGKPSRPGPGDQLESIADCGQTIQLRGESEDTNKVPDPVIQTGSDVQTHIMNTGTAHGQTDPCDTPPSRDSGVHSLEEHWENMSTESLDTTSEQIEGGPEQLAA